MTKPIKGMLPVLLVAMAGTGCTTTGDTTGFVDASYNAVMTGQAVTGGGDPDGFATAQVTVTRNTDAVCYNIAAVRDIGEPVAAHIHRAPAGQNGPVVAELDRAEGSGWNGCITDTNLMTAMLQAGPSAYYVQVMTEEYPRGAIRGQLRYD